MQVPCFDKVAVCGKDVNQRRVYWRPARFCLCADLCADPVHPRPGHHDALLDALGSDPRLGHRSRSVHSSCRSSDRRPIFRGHHDWPGVLLDTLGHSRHRRSVVRQPSACRRDRPGDSAVGGRCTPARGCLEADGLAADRAPDGRAASDVRLRSRSRADRLECRHGSGPRQGGDSHDPVGVAPRDRQVGQRQSLSSPGAPSTPTLAPCSPRWASSPRC